jgi:hypothetical protein
MSKEMTTSAPEGNRVERRCEQCGRKMLIKRWRVVAGGGRFCGLDCKAAWTSANVRGSKAGGWRGGLVRRDCAECHRPFSVKRSRVGQGHGRFCCRRCYWENLARTVRGPRARGEVSQRLVARAHWAVWKAVRRGELHRPGRCEKCGIKCRPHGHHASYDKPLEVQWLCSTCHTREHRRENADREVAHGQC